MNRFLHALNGNTAVVADADVLASQPCIMWHKYPLSHTAILRFSAESSRNRHLKGALFRLGGGQVQFITKCMVGVFSQAALHQIC